VLHKVWKVFGANLGVAHKHEMVDAVGVWGLAGSGSWDVDTQPSRRSSFDHFLVPAALCRRALAKFLGLFLGKVSSLETLP
jgi:hypothetical protein